VAVGGLPPAAARRILSACDLERPAFVLIAGDNAGNRARWCRKHIRLADDVFDRRLEGLTGE
jgi:hypothetical protein